MYFNDEKYAKDNSYYRNMEVYTNKNISIL